MQKTFPQMTDSPEGRTIANGIFYDIFCFIVVPYFMYWMVWGLNDDRNTLTTIELIYHVINFLVVVFLFWRYLADSFLNFQIHTKECLITAIIGILIIGGWAVSVFLLGNSVENSLANLAAFSALPLPEMELQMLASDQLYYSPLFATICLTLCVPVIVCCLYYATGFAPVCSRNSWLAYLLVALMAALPRLISALTFWDPSGELVIYLCQLPIHLVACWTYQKTDTVWTPIITLTACNLLSCLALLLLF